MGGYNTPGSWWEMAAKVGLGRELTRRARRRVCKRALSTNRRVRWLQIDIRRRTYVGWCRTWVLCLVQAMRDGRYLCGLCIRGAKINDRRGYCRDRRAFARNEHNNIIANCKYNINYSASAQRICHSLISLWEWLKLHVCYDRAVFTSAMTSYLMVNLTAKFQSEHKESGRQMREG